MANKVSSMIGQKLGKQGLGDLINFGTVMGTLGVISDYKDARKNGSGVVGAATKAAGTAFMMDAIGFLPYTLMSIATGLPGATVKGYESLAQRARGMSNMSRNIPFQNATFIDSQQAYTMRQAGMQMAQASKYNLQQTLLGNEAQYLKL